MPLDVKNWSAAFPRLTEVFEAIGTVAGSPSHLFAGDRCPRWSFGRVALVGDAAHGMPPTLDQGAGFAMMNCHALAELVTADANIERALKRWEDTGRFLTTPLDAGQSAMTASPGTGHARCACYVRG